MNRTVEKEWLDELPPNDPKALRSRRDLKRLNWWMRNAPMLHAAVGSLSRKTGPLHLLEIGAGDGEFLASVARRLGSAYQGSRATLLDRQNVLSPRVTEVFAELGWSIDMVVEDVFDWFQRETEPEIDLIVANLFLHHFGPEALGQLLKAAAGRGVPFVALEPRRSRLALAASRCVGLIGCNGVTRHDAAISVRAGFGDRELSELWPRQKKWLLTEKAAGLFGHLFIARPARMPV